jgi:hypothetical protein
MSQEYDDLADIDITDTGGDDMDAQAVRWKRPRGHHLGVRFGFNHLLMLNWLPPLLAYRLQTFETAGAGVYEGSVSRDGEGSFQAEGATGG